jgi:ribosomal protein L7/L12
LTESLPPEVRAAIDRGNKLEAIRLLRTKTGIGLAAAKDAVETGYLPDRETPSQSHTYDQLPAEVVTALQMGNKIEAIKLLREARSLGLKEAKDIVDAAERAVRSNPRGEAESLAPGQVPRSRFTPVLVATIAVLLGFAAWYLLGRK